MSLSVLLTQKYQILDAVFDLCITYYISTDLSTAIL